MKLTKSAQREKQRIIKLIQDNLARTLRDKEGMEIDLQTLGFTYELAMGLDTCQMCADIYLKLIEEIG